jgi:hypothetical protein
MKQAVYVLSQWLSFLRSTTPATVGAITGVGLLEGRRGFNWRLLIKFVAGWVLTIIVVVLLSVAFTAQARSLPFAGFKPPRTRGALVWDDVGGWAAFVNGGQESLPPWLAYILNRLGGMM